MAKLHILYNGTGHEPSTFEWCADRTPAEVEDKITDILSDGCVRIPSDRSAVGETRCRTVYVIPLHQIIRFIVELSEYEECPDPHD